MTLPVKSRFPTFYHPAHHHQNFTLFGVPCLLTLFAVVACCVPHVAVLPFLKCEAPAPPAIHQVDQAERCAGRRLQEVGQIPTSSDPTGTRTRLRRKRALQNCGSVKTRWLEKGGRVVCAVRPLPEAPPEGCGPLVRSLQCGAASAPAGDATWLGIKVKGSRRANVQNISRLVRVRASHLTPQTLQSRCTSPRAEHQPARRDRR